MTVPLAPEILDTFLSFVGTREIQPNRGFTGEHAVMFRLLLLRAGWEKSLPYCAFASTQIVFEAFQTANLPLPASVKRTGSTSDLAEHAQAHGKLGPYPASGCLGCMKGGSTGWEHTVIVHSVNNDGTFNSVEANCTNPHNENEQGVFARVRGVSAFDFVTW